MAVVDVGEAVATVEVGGDDELFVQGALSADGDNGLGLEPFKAFRPTILPPPLDFSVEDVEHSYHIA